MGKVDKNNTNRDHTNGNKIIIVGLSSDTDDKKLKAMCMKFGTVISASVVRDVATKRSKGYGFVKFESKEAQQDAIKALDKSKTHNKRTLNVREVEDVAPSARKSKKRKIDDLQSGDTKASGNARRPCAKFLRGKCDKGSSCKYAHMKIPEGYCIKYQLGKCHRGRACKWKHERFQDEKIAACG
mmetsp:Transcript_13777/g.16125  ORF Transcript_13777/g.16125 Transcript_13777/m.16125 type:complete len:184 (-) Transcript_13777:1406-1957(-)